jgi:hypothetical protein
VLGACLSALQRYAEAEPLLQGSYATFKARFGPQHKRTQPVIRYLMNLYEAWGKPEKAAEYRALRP